MYCTNCGQPMNDNQAICLNCGVKTGTGNSYCANCGNPITPGAEVCLNCGVATIKPFNGQDKMIVALICFFLGGFGIHNFMMGENKKGIMKIVLAFVCGVSSILALIDLVRILTDNYKVDPNALF